MNMHIQEVATPEGLFEAILARIDAARRRHAQTYLALRAGLALLSLVVLVPALQYAASQFAASGFFSYLSLAFSDSATMTTYWRELGLSLLDSLPSIALIAVIVPAGLLGWSVVSAARSARRAFRFA